jgi:hypothetical protein
LRVNGSLGNTAVTVSSGGTLGGSGSIAGPVTVASGASWPGNSIGTLTLGGNFAGHGLDLSRELNAAGQSDRRCWRHGNDRQADRPRSRATRGRRTAGRARKHILRRGGRTAYSALT